MSTKMTLSGALLGTSAIALAALAPGAFAQVSNQDAYLTTSQGNAVRAAVAGVCVHTPFWSPAAATPECDPNRVPKPQVVAQLAAPRQAPPPQANPAPPRPPAAPIAAPRTAPVIEKVTLHSDALFDFDKAVLRADAQSSMNDLVGKVKDVDVEVVIVVGYTDRLGSVAYNQKLSLRRAQAVKLYLVSHGVPENRISTEGRGKSQPVKECTQKNRAALIACLQPNRRVEVEVVGTSPQ